MVSPRKSRRIATLGTLVLGAALLLASIAVIIVRSIKLRNLEVADTGRQRALIQASELLISAPLPSAAPLPKLITRTDYGYPAAESVRIPEQHAVNSPAGDGEPAKPIVISPSAVPRSAISPALSDPAKAGPAPAEAGRAESFTGGAARWPAATGVAPAPNRKTRRNFIPSGIEDGRAGPIPGDALNGLTVSGALRVIDDADCPFRLSATRSDGGHVRAQIRSARAQGASGTSPGWFEAGDSPGAGWRLLKIAPTEVLLLDPQGNSVRLKVDSGNTQPAEALPTTKSARRGAMVAR